ncbi:MAG: VWA domain-containing protein [Planctomycetes bacterium]|nr:VWA domain-containing protein [Planctomycetota bacterium]
MTAIIGFAALSVDVGSMYNAKGDLQRTADAAALAAASKLSAFDEGNPTTLARAEALLYAEQNDVFGRSVTLDGSDVEFGRAVLVPGGGYDFEPTSVNPDAVRVRVRLTEGSSNGALSLYFARIFGYDTADIDAEAIAMLVPRDIAIVADLSGSHKEDSELRRYKTTDINLFEVWDDLPGGINDVGSGWEGTEFALDGDGYSPQMAGPAWGYMKQLGYGEQNLDANYDPTVDPGLVYLPKNVTWDDAAIDDSLAARGYSSQEIDAITAATYDGNNAWDERTAVALGLADWNSGIPGGRWEANSQNANQANNIGQQAGANLLASGASGNGNNWVGSSELQWTETFGDRSAATSSTIWKDYINNYMNKTWTRMYRANNDFQYQFGVKTFVNYVLERRSTNAKTPELAATRQQPMQAVKDAVEFMTAELATLDTDDRLSLEIYGETARHEVDLTANYELVSNRLSEMQASYYDGWTNMGGGIQRGIEELSSSRARPNSRKVMIVLTDGRANVTADGAVGDYENGELHARNMSDNAAAMGIRIFSVSVGSEADIDLMDYLADVGGGDHFQAEGSITNYSAQLAEIFQKLGGARPVELIR